MGLLGRLQEGRTSHLRYNTVERALETLADISSQDISSPDILSQPFGHMDNWSQGHFVTEYFVTQTFRHTDISSQDISSQDISSHGHSVTRTFLHRIFRHSISSLWNHSMTCGCYQRPLDALGHILNIISKFPQYKTWYFNTEYKIQKYKIPLVYKTICFNI